MGVTSASKGCPASAAEIARRNQDARPWETHSPDDDERARLDRLLGELPGDDEATGAHDAHEIERESAQMEMMR